MDGEITSILNSVKKKCGLDPEAITEFDADLIDVINTAIAILTQIGIGPTEGYSIHGSEEQWIDFIGDDPKFNMVKTYVTDKCRLIFDSSSMSSSMTQMIQDRINEYEWRLEILKSSPQAFVGG